MNAPVTLAPAIAWGEPAPVFVAPTPSNPRFHLNSLGGFYIVLAFVPSPGPACDAAFNQISANRALFDDKKTILFTVLRDPAQIEKARDQPPGLRFFLDRDGAVSRLYGALTEDGVEHPMWVVLDPSMRIYSVRAIQDADALFAELRATEPVDRHGGVAMHAPVLIVPRVLDHRVCRALIATFDAHGGDASGVMREIDGKTVGVSDDGFKKRRDANIDDEGMRAHLRAAIARRLLPQIERAFAFKVTRMERYIVARYDAIEGGHFLPHRDNTTKGTAHRAFAVTINLNADEYEGGDLRFPEFGPKTYRAPTGGAVVFSCSLLHEATPVTRGTRYAYLPFLYDDARAQIRAANAHLVTNQADAKPAED